MTLLGIFVLLLYCYLTKIIFSVFLFQTSLFFLTKSPKTEEGWRGSMFDWTACPYVLALKSKNIRKRRMKV